MALPTETDQESSPRQTEVSAPTILPSSNRRDKPLTQSDLELKLDDMRIHLTPLARAGDRPARAHADFPQTLLAYWMLTEVQLDELMKYYHHDDDDDQDNNDEMTHAFGCSYFCAYYPSDTKERITMKRRVFGDLIGIAGCGQTAADAERQRRLEDEGDGQLLERLRDQDMRLRDRLGRMKQN